MKKFYPVLGHSMRFLLEPGDAVLAHPCREAELRAGDIALLLKWEAGMPAGYVAHRVLLNSRFAGRRVLLTKGDANFLPDRPFSDFQPVAKIVSVSRAGGAWSARPGPAWPLAVAYSYAANKLLSLTVRAVFFLFLAAVFCLPRFFSACLNGLLLYWEARVYPAALRLISSVVRPRRDGVAAPESGTVKSGRIAADEIWSGKITVADYLIIERGVRVTVQPGSEINFIRREPWFFPVVRAGDDGTRRELDSSSAKILVYGSFFAAGAPDAPVGFGGPSFGGVHALGKGTLSLRDCRLENSTACALTVRDRAAAEVERCSFFSCSGGAEASGFSSLFIKSSLFKASAGPAVELAGRSLFEAADCVFSEGPSGIMCAGLNSVSLSSCSFSLIKGPGIFMRGAGSLKADSVSFKSNNTGADLGGSVRSAFASAVFEGQAGPAAVFSGRAEAVVGASLFSGNRSGLSAGGRSSLELRGCVFKNNGGPSLAISGRSRLSLLETVSDGSPAALALSGLSSASLNRFDCRSSGAPAVSMSDGASLRGGDCSFASGTDAVYAAGAGSLRLVSCRAVSASGAALGLGLRRVELENVYAEGAGGLNLRPGGAVSVRDLKIKARDYAIVSGADRFIARGLSASGGDRGGIFISSGRALIEEASIAASPAPGLAAAAGAALKIRGVCFEGQPWTPPARRTPSRRRPVFLFAAATAGLPGFRLLYRFAYLAAVRAAGALLCAPGVSSLYLYRGMASPGWVPALSDMDLACTLEYSSPEVDWAVYSRLRSRLRLLKALFPFTGELLCAGRRQLQALAANWGVKGVELRASSRLLWGRPLAPAGERGAGAVADDTEAFYSYTLLMRHLFSEDLPLNFRRRNCLKSLVDIKRYLDRDSADRVSRRDYAARIGLALERYSSAPELYSAFEAFRTLHSAAAASSAAGSGFPCHAIPVRSESGCGRHAFEAACEALDAGSGARLGVVVDALYRVYVVLPDGAAGEESLFFSAVKAMRRARREFSFLSASPLLLTASSFGFLSRLPYLNNPLFPLDLVPGGGGAVAPGCGGVRVHNMREVPGLAPAEILRAGAVLAARHFCASWRSLWEEMPPHYFYTRAVGLRLMLESDIKLPFSGPAELGAVFRRTCSGAVPEWKKYLAGGAERKNYMFISSQTEALTGLADGI